jgi:hypothetical protein
MLLVFLFTVSSGAFTSAAMSAALGDSDEKIIISGENPQPIQRPIYGQNYWCWNLYGDYVAGTEKKVTDLHLNLLRAGGYNNDAQVSFHFDPFSFAQIDKYVAYCHAVGAEPLLQVPLLKNLHNKPATPEDAAALVYYCNVTKKYNIKYWSIGNEPDIYEGKDKASYSINDFCRDFHNFSQAMKAVDPTIKILGPELSWKYYPRTAPNDWLTPFLQQCKGDFDIVSVHRYPFAANNCTIENALNDSIYFRAVIKKLRSTMDKLELSGIPLAITEAHITWDNAPANCKYPASSQTYYAAMWLADNLGAALEENVWNVSYWSISEGWYSGFLDAKTKEKRPSYYALQMFSAHFGSAIIQPAAPLPKDFSVYASRSTDNDRTILIIINKNQLPKHQVITFSNFAKSLIPREYDFPGYSITCLDIPDNGGAMQIWSYTKDLADKGAPPRQIQ